MKIGKMYLIALINIMLGALLPLLIFGSAVEKAPTTTDKRDAVRDSTTSKPNQQSVNKYLRK